MIFGAFKRMTIVDLLSYAVLAVPFVLFALILPEDLAIPGWAWAAAYLAVFVWIYRRRYGRF